jgi:hypothetical protein
MNMQAGDHSGNEFHEPSHDRRDTFLVRHKFLILGVAVAIIAASVIVFVLLGTSRQANETDGKQTGPTADTSDLFMQQYGQGCKNRDVNFTSAPMKMSDLSYIRPLGAVSDGHVTPTDHVYVAPPNPSAQDNTYPVLMPADGTVTQVDEMPASYIGDKAGQQVAVEDHRIIISFSCRYFAIYIHVHKLADALQSVVGTLQPNQHKTISVDLKAGDVVGYIGGSSFDWIPIDTSVKLSGFITPSMYSSEPWKIHTVSPFDLYKEPLKSQLEAKSLRTVVPLGGKIDYDQPGKLIGNWFREGTNGYQGASQDRYWDGHLSIAPDYVDPTATIVSMGNWQGTAMQFVVNGTVDPSKTDKASGPVKYELKRLNYTGPNGEQLDLTKPQRGMRVSQSGAVEGTVLLQVLDGEKLKLEKFPGKSASQVSGFTSAAQTYER